jgi:membrane fusion protein (multidrug efflux system)
VTPAERIGALWVIDSSLKAGERIVVEGLQKVRAGVKVAPVPVKIEEAGGAAPPVAPAGADGEAKGKG